MKLSNVFKSVLFLVLGILLCCSVIDPDSLLNWFISLSFLVSGAVMILMALVINKSLLDDNGITGAFILALGIFFLPSLPGGMQINWTNAISMVMMVIGALLLLDAILGFAYRRQTASNITVFVLGAAVFTIGICLWLIAEFRSFAGLMLGIFFIIYGVLLLVSLLTKKDILVIKVKPNKRK